MSDLSPETIRSPRLDLVVLAPALMDALITGDRAAARALATFELREELFPEMPEDVALFCMRRDQVRADAAWAPWSLRAVVLRETNTVVGTANFHGPPGINDTGTPGAAEVGYTIFPDYRNAGFATEIAQTMLAWANRAHGVTHFISGVAPDNAPALRVNAKLGFVSTGNIVDGELIFELHLPPAADVNR
ncbi:MAG: GNAT family N-acetyltransferase [Polyangiaceae bacterium]